MLEDDLRTFLSRGDYIINHRTTDTLKFCFALSEQTGYVFRKTIRDHFFSCRLWVDNMLYSIASIELFNLINNTDYLRRFYECFQL